MNLFPPYMVALELVLGLLLGQFAIRDWKWATLCGLLNAVAIAYLRPDLGLGFVVVAVIIGLPTLWCISRLPHLPARIGGAALAVPFVSWAFGVMGSLIIFALGGLLGALQ